MKKFGRKFIVLLAIFVLLGAALGEAAVKGLICYGNDPAFDQFNGEAKAGAETAKMRYGPELRLSSYICKEADPKEEDIPQLKEKWDFVIAIGDNFYNVMTEDAKKHSTTKYILVDSYKTTKLNNFRIVEFNNRELGYLAGIVAASASQTGTVGFIGGVQKVPALQEMLLGYTKGVTTINPQGIVLQQWVGNFNKPKKLTKLAKKMYNDKADVIFVPAGNSSQGIFAAAQEKKKLFVGCDGDAAKIAQQEAQNYVLASVTKGLEVSVSGNIQLIMEGRFSPGTKTLNYANKGISCIRGPLTGNLWQKPSQALLDFDAQNDLQQEDAFLKERAVKK